MKSRAQQKIVKRFAAIERAAARGLALFTTTQRSTINLALSDAQRDALSNAEHTNGVATNREFEKDISLVALE